MKDLLKFKARIAPLLGIVAMVAVMGLVTSCGEEEEPAAAPVGDFEIYSDYGFYVDYPITVKINVTSSSGSAKIGWLKESDKGIVNDPATTVAAFEAKVVTPSEKKDNNSTVKQYRLAVGDYVFFAVDDEGYDDWKDGTRGMPEFNVSAPIKIEATTQLEQASFLGQWKTKDPFSFNEGGQTISNVHETLTIGKESFKLDSSYASEHVYWKVTGWTKLTGTDLTLSETQKTYASGYKLTTTGISEKGYAAAVVYASFNIYLTSDATVELYRTNQAGKVTGTTTGSGANEVTVFRAYTQQYTPLTVPLQ